jgi:predicted enzyme related to lactoylglutathione lyase
MEKLIAWVEIPAKDFRRAVSFYETILDIEMSVAENEEEKMAFLPTGEGAISYAKDFNPSKDGALVSFNARTDLDVMLKSISVNGGKMLIPKTKIESEDHGYFAVFLDCEGNRVGLYSND